MKCIYLDFFHSKLNILYSILKFKRMSRAKNKAPKRTESVKESKEE